MTPLEKKLLRKLGQADKRFDLINDGDRVMVAVSGGKDSWGLLKLLRVFQQRSPLNFHIIAVTLDQGQPGFDGRALERYYEAHQYEYRVEYRDTYSVVVDKTPEGKAFCALCSRMRRGILYRIAENVGANKIALGHHRDDFIETLLLNQFYAGRIRAMAPKLIEANGGATVIRPLVLAAESDLAEYAVEQAFPIIPCNLCGSQEQLKRKEVKALLATLEKTNPRIRGNLLAALGNVESGHLLLADEAPADISSDEAFSTMNEALVTITPASES